MFQQGYINIVWLTGSPDEEESTLLLILQEMRHLRGVCSRLESQISQMAKRQKAMEHFLHANVARSFSSSSSSCSSSRATTHSSPCCRPFCSDPLTCTRSLLSQMGLHTELIDLSQVRIIAILPATSVRCRCGKPWIIERTVQSDTSPPVMWPYLVDADEQFRRLLKYTWVP